MALPTSTGWHPWQRKAGDLPEPRFVCNDPQKGLCVMQWRQVVTPVAEVGGMWGKRIASLQPKGGT